MTIEELDVSEACREKLISSGFRDVDEIVKFLLHVPGKATFTFPWIDYFEEVVDKLKLIGLLPEDLFNY